MSFKTGISKMYRALLFTFGLLTRLHLPGNSRIGNPNEIIHFTAAFFPIAGLFYGILWYLAAMGCNKIHTEPEISALILLCLPYFFNGFFHLDGLSDTFDAFLADRTKTERLMIMKDSRIGSFALAGLVIYFLAKWIFLKKIIFVPDSVPLLLIIPVLSRFSMAALGFVSNYPRENGTGKAFVGRIPASVFTAGLVVTLFLSGLLLLFFGLKFLVPVLTCFITAGICTVAVKFYSGYKIGGVTGDVLGALNETVELALLIIVVILK